MSNFFPAADLSDVTALVKLNFPTIAESWVLGISRGSSRYSWLFKYSTHVHHLLTRVMHETLLHNDRIPAPSFLSPFNSYSHPGDAVCVNFRKR